MTLTSSLFPLEYYRYIVFVSRCFSYSFNIMLYLFNTIFLLTLQSDSPFIQQLFRPVTESGK